MEATAVLSAPISKTGDIAINREALRRLAIEAMSARIGLLPHIEQRVHNDIVAPCPIAEILGELMHEHCVASELLRLLRESNDPAVRDLRTRIARTYADKYAPRLTALGWGAP